MDGSKYVAQIGGFKYPYSPPPGYTVSGDNSMCSCIMSPH